MGMKGECCACTLRRKAAHEDDDVTACMYFFLNQGKVDLLYPCPLSPMLSTISEI